MYSRMRENTPDKQSAALPGVLFPIGGGIETGDFSAMSIGDTLPDGRIASESTAASGAIALFLLVSTRFGRREDVAYAMGGGA